MAIDIKAVLTAVDRTGPALKSAQDGMNELVTVARRATAALAGIFSVREVGRIADEYAGLQARLRLASRDAQEFAAANDAVRRIATASQGPLAETATLYLRIASSLKDTQVAQAAMVDTTEAVALALRISGSTAAESASGMLQFSQAIAGGALRGEEFNAISESAPRLLQALADGLGKPVGALREMAKEGKLTRDVLIDALSKQLPTLRAEAESLPQTISGAFTTLGNEILLVVGEIDQATKASSTFSKGLLEIGHPAVLIVFQTLAVLVSNVAFVFRVIAMEIGGMMAAMDAVRRFDFKGAFNIRKMVSEDARQARAELDALEKRIMDIGKSRPATAPGGGGGAGRPTPAVLDKSALAAAKRESEALKKAQEALRKAREDAEAQGLADGIEARRTALEAARKQELVDEETFIRAKAALDEEGRATNWMYCSASRPHCGPRRPIRAPRAPSAPTRWRSWPRWKRASGPLRTRSSISPSPPPPTWPGWKRSACRRRPNSSKGWSRKPSSPACRTRRANRPCCCSKPRNSASRM